MQKIDYIFKTNLGGSISVFGGVNLDVIATFANTDLGKIAFSYWCQSMMIHHTKRNEVFRLKDALSGEYITPSLEDIV